MNSLSKKISFNKGEIKMLINKLNKLNDSVTFGQVSQKTFEDACEKLKSHRERFAKRSVSDKIAIVIFGPTIIAFVASFILEIIIAMPSRNSLINDYLAPFALIAKYFFFFFFFLSILLALRIAYLRSMKKKVEEIIEAAEQRKETQLACSFETVFRVQRNKSIKLQKNGILIHDLLVFIKEKCTSSLEQLRADIKNFEDEEMIRPVVIVEYHRKLSDLKDCLALLEKTIENMDENLEGACGIRNELLDFIKDFEPGWSPG